MSKNIKEAILDCSDIISDIMDKIADRLSDNNIKFTHSNQSEIIAYNVEKIDIVDIVSDINELKDNKYKLLLQITEGNEKVFIRLKFK